MDVKLERVQGTPGILVKDDPNDNLKWDSATKSGRLKWNWKNTEGDGVVIGPFVEGDGWCVEWSLFEDSIRLYTSDCCTSDHMLVCMHSLVPWSRSVYL